jgi:hypothetical protein
MILIVHFSVVEVVPADEERGAFCDGCFSKRYLWC